MVKVLDGTFLNQHHWVFVAGATDLGLTLTVTDTETNSQVVYSSRTGEPLPTVTNTAVFQFSGKVAAARCHAAAIFEHATS